MIEGCAIFDRFKRVYASKFIYQDDVPVWPAVGVNYTTKTQYLFRINKGIGNHWDRDQINSFMPEEDRPIPFERMVFIGDGDTDIPTMKMMTYKGGHSIAVYEPPVVPNDARDDPDHFSLSLGAEAGDAEATLSKIHRLIADGRVDFVAPADYRERSQLAITLRGILGRIALKYRAEIARQSNSA